ncbi:MAG: nitronate monooxygenase [Novosphingobium sp.]|nr:nitronate monooxygenase [Novosphingobium sp.]
MASPRVHGMFGRLAVPVIAAPMFLVSTPELVIAACKAGVIGAIPAANARSPEEFAGWIERVADELEAFEEKTGRKAAPFAVNIPVHAPDEASRMVLEANLETCRRYRPGLIITVFGNPAPVVDVAREWGGRVVHDVTNIRHAQKAIAAGVDGLVLIASGGGGHSGTLNPFVFVSEVRRIFDGLVVLAGGMADGAAVLAAEALGADLCYMGTRFIATQESGAADDYKRMIVEAGSGDVIYTPAFSHGVPAMMLRASIARWGYDPDNLPAAGEQDVSSPAAKPWKDIWAAGQSVALIDDVPPVETLVARIADEYAQARDRLNMRMSAIGGACA